MAALALNSHPRSFSPTPLLQYLLRKPASDHRPTGESVQARDCG
jgi:hypothetical protein